MESTRNLTGRRSDSDSRIQLREGHWDSVGYPVRKVAAKIILSKRSGWLRSRRMKIIVKSTDSAKSASGVRSSFQKFRFQRFLFTQIPPFSRNPLFPASGPATHSFNGLHFKSKFLGIRPLRDLLGAQKRRDMRVWQIPYPKVVAGGVGCDGQWQRIRDHKER